jgi:hypothetical protein
MKEYFTTYSERPFSISIASIHGTIISIFIAVFSTFGLFVHNLAVQEEDYLIKEANKAEYLIKLSSSKSVGGQSICSKELSMSWKEKIDVLKGIEDTRRKTGISSASSADDLFCLIYASIKDYPFIQIDELQRKATGNHRFYFQSYEEVKQWIEDSESTIDLFMRNKEYIYKEIKDKLTENIGTKYALEYLDNCYKMIEDISNLLSKLSLIMNKHRTYYKSLPKSPGFVLFLILFTAFTFYCGVIHPMLNDRICNFYLIIIPLCFYVFVFCYIATRALIISI